MRTFLFGMAITFGLVAQDVKIGVLIDGPSPYLQEVLQVVEVEVADLLHPEYKVEFKPILWSDWTTKGLENQLDELLFNPDVEMIVTVGLLSSTVAAVHGALSKPVITTGLLDEAIPGIKGTPNLTFVELGADMARDLEAFQKLVPFDRVTMLVDEELYRELPGVKDRIDMVEKELGIHITVIPTGEWAQPALRNIPKSTEVVYITPLLQMPKSQFKELVEGIRNRRLPSFSLNGEDDVRNGVLMGLAPASDLPRLGRRVALNVQRILMGEKPEMIPTEMMGSIRLSVNRETADLLGISLPWTVLGDALVLGKPLIEDQMSMGEALNWALNHSPVIWSERYNVRAGCGEVGVRRSALFPQLGIGGEARLIDKARARESLGRHPQRLVRGRADATQMIYNERDVASYQVEKYRQQGRLADLRTVKLDVLFEAGAVYINLLRLKSLLQIEENNLELTRKNLLFAEIRREVGVARNNEVYRWESQLASNKDAVAQAAANVKIAEAELNRILARPALHRFSTQEKGLKNLLETIGQEQLVTYLNTPKSVKCFTQFQIDQGWKNAPELQSLNAAMRAQYREIIASRRSFWLPDFELFASSEQRFVRGGVGVNPAIPLVGRKGAVNDWDTGIRMTFPLFQGGLKFSRLYRDKEDFKQIHSDWRAEAYRISFNVSSATDQLVASHLGIDYTASAVDAANKNFNFVADAYARGVVPIIDLLDAQTTLLVAQQEEITSQFDFALDLFTLMRAVGRFDFFCSSCEREKWFNEMDAYFQTCENY